MGARSAWRTSDGGSTNQQTALASCNNGGVRISSTAPSSRRPRSQSKQQQQEAPQDAKLLQETARRTGLRRIGQQLGFNLFALLLVAAVCSVVVTNSVLANESAPQRQLSAADSKTALEAELNSILQQQELGQSAESAPNSKLLSEAIISRLMLGNLTDIGPAQEAELDSGPLVGIETSGGAYEPDSNVGQLDAQRLRRIINYLQNVDQSQFPVLPLDQAATIKRASMKVGNYLRQQSHNQHNNQRQMSGYRNSYDFGLGKRPDSSAGAGNILRLGDSSGLGGHMAAVSGSGLGKRPAAHRYDFGLGKRVASPAYPRYDFGLGKRAPGNRIRYDFGLGK